MRTTTAGDRRPLTARHWQISRSLAKLLSSLQVSPNVISAAGLLFGLAAGVALVATRFNSILAPAFWLLAAFLVILRLAANMLDGMVAIETNTTSRLGELFNEVPDRISDSAALIGLGYAAGGHIALGFIAAIAAMFTAYIRTVGKVAGASQQFCGPMAKPQRMNVIVGVALLCATIPTDWAPLVGLILITVGSLMTAIRRLTRIAIELRRSAP